MDNYNEKKENETDTLSDSGHERTDEEKQNFKRHRKPAGGKIAALIIGLIVILYMLFSVPVFYHFVRLLMSQDKDSSHVSFTVTNYAQDDVTSA